jgi:hypothetical protein
MTHLAMQEIDDPGSPAIWGEHITDEEYNAAPREATGPQAAAGRVTAL